MSELADRWSRAVPALVSIELRAAYLRSELAAVRASEAAAALDVLAGRAEQADPRAREVLAAAVHTLADPALEATVELLRELATLKALLPLGRLLRRAHTHTVVETLKTGEHAAASKVGRALTLGQRKALARKPTRAMMEKLVADPHPAVARLLLGNPRMTEDDVVRMAARRPGFPEVIAEIVRSPWSQRPRVRMAVVQNPGTAPELAVPLVGLLVRPELEQLAYNGDVPAIVRAAALELLSRRPPVPERRFPGGGAPPRQ